MAFPTTLLPIKAHLDLDGTGAFATDITEYVMPRDNSGRITIDRGRTREGQTVDRGRCSFQLNNRDGRFTEKNPTGPYYGQIGRNTAIRISVEEGESYLHNPNTSAKGASCPDTAALSITGDIDIRVDMTINNWFAHLGTTDTIELCGKGDFAAAGRAWLLEVREHALFFEWSTDGTATLNATSTEFLPVPPHERLAVRVTLDVNVGGTSKTVTFYTSDSIDGTWTQLGDPVTTAGTTSIFNDGHELSVGEGWDVLAFDAPVGKIHAFQLRTGIDGTVVANPDFTIQTPGDTSFADTATSPNTWTVSASAEITNRKVRFTGEVTAWPTRWDTSGNDVWTEVDASGPLQRLKAGNQLQSALRRRIPAYNPVAYWPMEDGEKAEDFASAVAGGEVMHHLLFTLAADNTLAGSTALPTVETGGRLNGGVLGGNVGEWHVEHVFNIPSAVGSEHTVIRWWTSGTAAYWEINVTATDFILRIYDHEQTLLSTTTTALPSDAIGDWNRFQCFAVQDGADIDFTVRLINIDTDSVQGTGTLASRTCGRVTAVTGPKTGYGSGLSGMTIGHIAVFDDADTLAFNFADHGFSGETAAFRIERMGDESNIPVILHSITDQTELVGGELFSTALANLQDAADVDHGILMEDRESASLVFRDLNTLLNQEPSATFTYPTHLAAAPQEEPDDQLVENLITVTRRDGSSATAELLTGRLSTQQPPNGAGVYAQSYEINLDTDDRNAHHAGFLLHFGTNEDSRYPMVSFDISARPALLETVTLLDTGIPFRITNPGDVPEKLPPGDIDLLVQGYREELHQNTWTLTFNCTPYSPYRVGVADDTDARADTDGSELQANITSSATTMQVKTTDGEYWTRDSGQYPFDIAMGGERLTATAAAPTAIDDFSANQTNSWGSADTGGLWTLSGGTNPGDYDVAGGFGTHTMGTVNVSRRSYLLGISYADIDLQAEIATSATATGNSITGGLMARFADADNLYTARLAFATTGLATLSLRKRVAAVETTLLDLPLNRSYTAGVTFTLRFQVRGTVLRAKAWPTAEAEPNGWHAYATDSAITAAGAVGCRSILVTGNTNATPIVSYDNFVINDPLTWTVTRSVNDVVKAQTAGTDIRLFQPAIAAL